MSLLEEILALDIRLFLWLNSLHTPFLDFFMYYATGRLIWLPLYILLAYLLFKKYGKRFWFLLPVILLIIVSSDQGSVLVKNFFQRLRPCHHTEIAHLVHLVYDYCGGKFGFVSSHATNVAALATFVMFYLRNNYVRAGIICWALLQCYTRIYLGAHYPTDILGGLLLGFTCAWIILQSAVYLKPQIFSRI